MKERESTKKIIPDLGEVRKGGLKGNFWYYVKRMTGQFSVKRFISQGIVLTLLSDLPTIWATILRGQAYRSFFGHIGESCFIERNVRIRVPQRIFLGDRVFIGENAVLDACLPKSHIRLKNDVRVGRNSIIRAGIGKVIVHEGVTINRFSYIDGNGSVEIGKNTLLGNKVELISGNHIFDDPTKPIKRQGTILGKITIGEDVWLGVNVTVLPGIRIGKGSVVGAGSVVTRNIPDYSVAVGVPAKVIKKRGTINSIESSLQ